MTAPGWYHAQGDPPASQRYWDGAQWVGEPVYEPVVPAAAPQPPLGGAPPPAPPAMSGGYTQVGAPPAASVVPNNLRAVAIVLSILKTIPLLFGLIALVFLASVWNDVEDQGGQYNDFFDAAVGAASAVLLVMVLVGGALLGTQFAGAIKRRPMMIFVPALIMAALDTLLAIGAWLSWNEARNDFVSSGDSPFWALLMTVVAAAQIWVAVQAIRANSSA